MYYIIALNILLYLIFALFLPYFNNLFLYLLAYNKEYGYNNTFEIKLIFFLAILIFCSSYIDTICCNSISFIISH